MQSIGRATDATLDVLEVLIGPGDDLYGLSIAEAAGRKTGVVYPILSRLELAGWVDSSWEADERTERGPRRRFYRLTPTGLESARALLVERRGHVRQRSAATGRGNSAPRPASALREQPR
ncbi:PadR family transcriptional regulator [Amycolatopsis sp. NPDC004772]